MRSKGMQFEEMALNYLKNKGLTFVQANFSSRYGEIDLIMQDKTTLVFVEVRYRQKNRFGSAEESVITSKQRKIILSAKHFLNKNKLWHRDCRFDIIAISANSKSEETININWLQAAFYDNEQGYV